MTSSNQNQKGRKMPLCPHCMQPMTPFDSSNESAFPNEMGLVCKSGNCKQEDGTPYRFSFRIG